MCGLFGIAGIAPAGADPRAVAGLTWALGLASRERGVHGAGVACLFAGTDGDSRTRGVEPADATTATDLRTSRLRIVKTPGAFDTMPSATPPGSSADANGSPAPPQDLAADLNRAAIVLGHTRFRTQGAPAALEHTSPLLVDSVVGTHNGDVDVDTLPAPPPRTRPGFDTELLLAALSDVAGDRAAICDLLTGMVGRTALVWVDLRDPTRLHLARAALSPLAVARDQFGRLHWASNPGWLRTHLPAVGLRPTGLRMLPEGTVETYDLCSGVPEPAWRADFVPTARDNDLRKRHSVALLGYTDRDRTADDAQLRHRVLSSSE
jgi:glucosamine--fructose-6-phosphate aminotransferase (isomerizing)